MGSNKTVRAIVLVLRLLLGGIFVYAAWVKLKDPMSRALFAIDLDAYKIIPLRYVETVAWIVPSLEMIAGLGLIVSAAGILLRPHSRFLGFCLRLASAAISLSLVVFIAAMSWAKLSGKNINCGCFGPGEPISWKTMLRDGSMLVGALFVTLTAFFSRRKNA